PRPGIRAPLLEVRTSLLSVSPTSPEMPRAAAVLPAAAEALLARLRARRSAPPEAADAALAAEWVRAGVAFAASSPPMEAQYDRAVQELFACIRPAAGGGTILHEGGVYHGCWL